MMVFVYGYCISLDNVTTHPLNKGSAVSALSSALLATVNMHTCVRLGLACILIKGNFAVLNNEN